MRTFRIEPVDRSMEPAIRQKIDNLNKPKGSLGRLEELALQVCLVQHTLTPSLAHPCHLLLGADHGIEREGVSVSPREVTWQQMINFTRGGGGCNMLCRQHGFKMRVVDVGVDYDFAGVQGIVDRKVARGTNNFLNGPAMSAEELDKTIEIGAQLTDDCVAEGCQVLSIGEMGIGNTSPSSIWMSLFGNIPLDQCIGAGAGLDTPGLRHKREVLEAALRNYKSWLASQQPKNSQLGTPVGNSQLSPLASSLGTSVGNSQLSTLNSQLENTSQLSTLNSQLRTPVANSQLSTLNSQLENTSQLSTLNSQLRYFGGFEMTTAIGAMLRAAERHVLVLVDGFIMTACAIAAIRLCPAAQDYMVFGHEGDESGHRRMLAIVGARPLLSLGLRLGEGTGALCAFPILDSAVRMMNEMNNFDNAHITKYF